MEVVLSIEDEEGFSIAVTSKCDTWDHVKDFIRDFKANMLSKKDGETPSRRS